MVHSWGRGEKKQNKCLWVLGRQVGAGRGVVWWQVNICRGGGGGGGEEGGGGEDGGGGGGGGLALLDRGEVHIVPIVRPASQALSSACRGTQLATCY